MRNLRLSIQQVLMVVAIPLVVALIISVFVAGREMNSIRVESERVFYEHLYVISSNLINADRDFYQAMLAATEYHAAMDADNASKKAMKAIADKPQDYEENKEQTIEGIREVAQLAKQDADIWTGTKVGGSDATFEQLFNAFEENFAEWEGSYNIEANEGNWDAFNTYFEETRSDLSTMSDITEKWAVTEKDKLESGIMRTIVQMSIVFAVIIILLLVLVLLMNRMMRVSMAEINEGIHKLSSGDFVTIVDEDSRIKDFAAIQTALEGMRKQLQSSLLRVIEHANDVDERALETGEMITNSQRMTGDINSAVSDLANGATSMAQDVMETSNVTIDMGDAVDRVMASAQENLDTGRTVYSESEEVQRQLAELKEAGAHTDRVAGEVAESVDQTSDMVEKISNAAEAIISIASQTNLLSLNASIEAARAGEAGKGFAVVANEIKELAEESDKTAKEITEMLGNITELSENNRKLTEAIKESTSNEAVVLQEMITAFDEMLGMLRKTEEGNESIMNLVESLNQNKGSIMTSVESLSAISEQNAASTQETSASLDQLNDNMSSVADHANSLRDIANELQENVSFFTVEG